MVSEVLIRFFASRSELGIDRVITCQWTPEEPVLQMQVLNHDEHKWYFLWIYGRDWHEWEEIVE